MKKVLLQLALFLYASALMAQWVPINNGLSGFPPTALWPSVDVMLLGSYGGGVHISYDHGDNWTDYSGDLPNLFVNDVRTHLGLIVATDGGPFATYDGATYFDCTGTGLTNTEINFFTFGNEGLTGEFMVGTKGGGLFAGDHTSPWILEWTAASTGLSGEGLHVNDGIGVHDGWALIGTDGGVYRALEGETEWTAVNTGLSGEALKVQRFGGFTGSLILIATDGGLYYSNDLGDNWGEMIPGEKFTNVFFHQSDIYPTGTVVYAFGENGYYTDDLATWTQMDFEGIEGEVTASMVDSTHLYLGFTIPIKDEKGSGGIFRKPVSQVVGIGETPSSSSGAVLHQNFPNPFSGTTNITYTLSGSGSVSLKVFNITGKEIHSLVNEFQTLGTYAVPFDASHLGEGIYFYSLKVGDDVVGTKRMVFVR